MTRGFTAVSISKRLLALLLGNRVVSPVPHIVGNHVPTVRLITVVDWRRGGGRSARGKSGWRWVSGKGGGGKCRGGSSEGGALNGPNVGQIQHRRKRGNISPQRNILIMA
ncbi:hypothetical protein B0H34DRAFT_716053 [Crassisporium funariophilum]|nr:hypothetical protein B0H34DRAFT_716053 [Crassisporium funariophilum]